MDAEGLRDADVDLPVAVLAPDAPHRLADLLGQVEVDGLDADPTAAVDPAYVQQIVDQSPHAAHL
jgi:hypothetical protein